MNNIIYEVSEAVGTLTINRPPLNIMDIATMEEIVKVLKEKTNGLKALVITGAGNKAFSAGVGVEEHTKDKTPQMLETFHKMFCALEEQNTLTIAAVRGYALGGGFELAMACDLIFASNIAWFGQPEIKLSVFPPVALFLLPKIVGLKKSLELILSGQVIDAQEAQRLGLVNKVVSDLTFDEELKNFLKPYLELSAIGLKYTKRALRISAAADYPQGLKEIEKFYLEELMKTFDAQEGITAFLEKRKPNFQNR